MRTGLLPAATGVPICVSAPDWKSIEYWLIDARRALGRRHVDVADHVIQAAGRQAKHHRQRHDADAFAIRLIFSNFMCFLRPGSRSAAC